MKTRVRLKGWIVPALCLVLFSGCSKSAEEAEWAATVEMVGGIKVVTNPEEPKYGEFAFDLEEDLAIGDVNDENYFFPRHVTPNVDDEGNIYVCDGGNRRVLPGPQGTFLGSTQPSARTEGGAKTSVIQIAENGEPLRTIAEYPISFSESQKALVLHWYTHNVAISQRAKDSFYYGFSRDYKIHVADSEGRTIFIFAKVEKPTPVSVEEKELTKKDGIYAAIGTNQREKAIVFPNRRRFFTIFVSDDTGRLYVIRFKSILERDKKTSLVDVFSKEGIYLYRMNWPFIPSLIKKGYLYEVREIEDPGEIKVLRHKINNWDEFRRE